MKGVKSMASFKRRGKTWTYVISHTVNGQTEQITKGGFRTKGEAKEVADEIERKLKKGILVHLEPILLKNYFEDWYKLYKVTVEESTLHHYKYTLNAIEEHLNNVTIQELSKRDYQKFINKFGEGKSKETVAKVNSHIRECALDAIDEGIIQVDFTRKVKIHYTVEAKKRNEKHLNYKDSKTLINEVINRLEQGLGYYMILLAVSSGLRYAELIGLTRNDFNFKKNTINVNKTWGYKSIMPEGFGPTKNESSNRIVDISPKVMMHFKTMFKNTPTNLNQLVFFSGSSKYKVISNTNANKLLKKVLEDLNIGVITLHGLRHTYASVLLYKRLSLGYVSESLGHKNTIRTQQDYAHVLSELKQEDGQKALSIFDEMVG